MMLASLAALALAVLLGLAVAAGSVQRAWPLATRLVFVGSLAIGVGFGLSSCGYFLWLVLVGPATRTLALTELAIVIGVVVTLGYSRLGGPRAVQDRGPAHPAGPSKTPPLLSLSLWFTVLCGVTAFMLIAFKTPHGAWDAFGIWNARARYLFRGGEHWRDAFSTVLPQPDYPLLMPGVIARSWTYVAGETVLIPILVAMLFTFATVGLLGSSLTILRGTTQGRLAALFLAGTPFLITHGASQYADVPLGFFFLATVVLLSLNDGLGVSTPALTILAGMMAGFAVWTKNEGWLFLVALLATRCAVMVWLRGMRAYLAEVRTFAVGLLPILAIVIYFKIQFAATNDLVAAQGQGGTIDRLGDLARWVTVLRGVRDEIIRFGSDGINEFIRPSWLLLTYLVCVGIAGAAKHKLAASTSAIVFGLMLGGYILVYVSTPLNLLSGSLSRLLLQLWPTVLFAYFLIASTPDEARG